MAGIAPFYLYAQPDRPWMCLLRAFAIWWVLSQEKIQDLDGLVFRKRIGTDSISVDPTDALVCFPLDSSCNVAEYFLLADIRPPKPFLNAFVTTSLTSELIHVPMAHTHSVVEAASTSMWC